MMDPEICLTCLSQLTKAHNVNEIVLENLRISEMLQYLVPLDFVEQYMSLPDSICANCLDKLVLSYKFRRQCLNSLHSLKKSAKESGQQKLPQSLKESEDNEWKPNEYNNSNENAMESVPENKEEIKKSIAKFENVPFDAHEDIAMSSNKNFQNQEESKDTLNSKSACKVVNSDKELFDKNHSEETSPLVPNQCKLCNKIFKQPQGLASHMSKTHLKKYLYQCQKCDKGFSAEEPFIKHCNRHLGIKPFPCSQCDKAFETNTSLSQHILCHSKEYSYSCTICEKKFYRLDMFKQHKLRHEEEKLFKCLICAKNFTRFSDHIKHKNQHKMEDFSTSKPNQHIEQMDKNSYKCLQCNKVMNTNTNQNQKIQTENQNYQCQFCSNVFCQNDCLTKHLICVHKENNDKLKDEENIIINSLNENLELARRELIKESISNKAKDDVVPLSVEGNSCLENKDRCVIGIMVKTEVPSENIKEQERNPTPSSESSQCNLCNQIFKNPQGLAIHRASTHYKNHLYQCDQCDRGFSVEEHYIKHRNRHLGIKAFKCSECGKAFETNSILNQHLITHSKLTPHLCTVCGKSFRRIDGLRQHMKRHGNDRPFKCTVCPKSFKCLSDKLKHTTIHNEKRYECNICGTRLATSESLSQHQMTHTGRKPFKCSHCDKSFISLSNMRCHERIHTGEKPYKCEYCWKTFRQSNDRNKHTTRMHKNEINCRNSAVNIEDA